MDTGAPGALPSDQPQTGRPRETGQSPTVLHALGGWAGVLGVRGGLERLAHFGGSQSPARVCMCRSVT